MVSKQCTGRLLSPKSHMLWSCSVGFFSCRIALKILSIIALTDRGNTNSACFQNVEISANTQLTVLDNLKR